MEQRNLGRTGVLVPAVGMGTWKTFDVRGADAEGRCAEVAKRGFEHGITLFDTSPMYGEAERVLAGAVKPMRDRVLIADKVWTSSPSEGREQVRRALEWYGTVDIYQVHNLVSWREHLPLLHDLRDQGRVRVVGATHYQHAQLAGLIALMQSGQIGMVQIPYNAADRFVEREVLPQAHELGIGILVMQPLGTGSLMRKAPRAREFGVLERFGVRTWAQALLKWILSDTRVHCALPATSNPDHAVENARAADPPWFDDEARELVAALASR